MENKRFLIGSKAFFSGMEGFEPKDSDFLTLVKTGNGFSHFYQMTDGTCCHYIFIRKSKKEMIDYALNNGPAMQVGKFLVPAVATELKLTIQNLKKLKPLITKLDIEHIYEEAIYEAYIENNGFFLTDEQRQKAFGLYRAARPYPIDKGRRQH